MPRYEFVEGTSSKFWEITLEETTVRTRWGRIGTEGQEKEEEFDSKGEARKAYDKAIESKVKKGYALASGDGPGAAAPKTNPELEAAILQDLDGVEAWLTYGEWLRTQGDVRGELIALQAAHLQNPAGKQDKEVQAFVKKHQEALLGELAEYAEYLQLTWHLGFIKGAGVYLTYDGHEEGLSVDELILPALFRNPSARFLRELTLGCVSFEGDNDYGDAIKVIAKSAPKTLVSLHLGDFTYEDCELSWSSLGNAEPLWKAFPGLRTVKLRAGSMTLGPIVLPECRSFTVETGGLARASMKSIAQARWPKLETLEVWFGDENYGAQCTVKDVQPVLDAQGLPNLSRLGLMNAEFTNELVAVLPDSRVLRQLRELDLSKGTLTAEGAEKLVAAQSAFAHLKKLDLRENLLGDEAVKRVKAMGSFVDASDQRDDGDEENRYVAVGE